MNETRRQDAEARRSEAMEHVAERARRGMEDTRFDPLRPLPRRRALVAAWALVTAGCVAAVLTDDPILTLAAIVVGGLGVWLLRVVVRAVVDLPDEVLDERMIAARNRVYHRAYTILAGGLSLTLVALSIGWDAGSIAYEMLPHHLDAVLWAVLFVGLGLPSAVYAWTQTEV